jgi:hypothetical protein
VSGGLEVTKGSPDDEELAAVVIAVEVIAARAVASEPEPVSRWRTSLRERHEWGSRI